jgi:beta-lactamase class D
MMLPILLQHGEDVDVVDARRAWAEFAVTHSLDEQYDFIERLVNEAAHFGYDSA